MKKVLSVLLLSATINLVPNAAFAGCFEDLANCYSNAATRKTWFSRWLAGLDCELDFIECGRQKLIGG